MKEWFDALEPRERNFVLGGAAVVVLALVYNLLWAPLNAHHEQLKTDVENWQLSLAELRPLGIAQGSGDPSQAAVTLGSQQSPIIIVDQTLQSRGLDRYRRRSQPTTSNGIRVEFENVAFDELMLWLGDLGDQYAMHVQAGSFAAGSQLASGRVNATLTLERAL